MPKAAKNKVGGSDKRQRVVVKIHFFSHAGGGAALKAHARYIGREDARAGLDPEHDQERETEAKARAHADYLDRSDQRSSFYDSLTDEVDGRARLAVWAREDQRHFRLIIAAENGAQLKELRPFIRDVMESAERATGTRLEWVAVDHFDTGQPHTHIVLRGKRANGRPLILPREFVKHGMREVARTIATQRLGLRTRDDERHALEREALAHRRTRLDRAIERRLSAKGELRGNDLAKREDDPNFSRALKLRVRELQRLGLAIEIRRNVFAMCTGWQDRLTAMELHLDIRKSLMRRQAQQQIKSLNSPTLWLWR